MEHYPHRDFGSGEEDHHHHPHRPHLPHFSSTPPHPQDRYGSSHAHDAHNAHTPPPGPHGTQHMYPPSGPYPYGTHDSWGHSHPHHPAPHGGYLPPELAHPGQILPEGQVLRIFCQGDPAFNLAVHNNTVVMQHAHSQDEAQQWIKDSSYGLRVKDNYGYPAFSLVNKKTRKILKHSKEDGKQVLLIDYRPNIHDDDILWSESQDFGEGFKTVRSASDTLLNLTIFEGNKKIRNGSALVLDTWHKGDHQLWKLFPL